MIEIEQNIFYWPGNLKLSICFVVLVFLFLPRLYIMQGCPVDKMASLLTCIKRFVCSTFIPVNLKPESLSVRKQKVVDLAGCVNHFRPPGSDSLFVSNYSTFSGR